MKSTEILWRLVIALTLCLVLAVPPKRTVAAFPENLEAHVESVSLNNLQQVEGLPGDQEQNNRYQQYISTKLSNKTIFCMSMAFLTGWVDTVCYRRYNCFVNMMTGNTIRFATSLAESQWVDALFHMTLIATYVVGVGIFRAIDLTLRYEKEAKESEHHLLVVVAPLIVSLFMLADVVSHFVRNDRIHAPILSLGFGIMNAASADATGGTMLYAMTGHINRCGKCLVDYVMLSKVRCYKSFKSHLRIVSSFAAGIALSGMAAQHLLPRMSGFQPPMATMVGVFFAALFVWYGSVPVKSNSPHAPM